MLYVPARYQPPFSVPYPSHQSGPLIEEFACRWFKESETSCLEIPGWTYLSVYWTSYFLNPPCLPGGGWLGRQVAKLRGLSGRTWDPYDELSDWLHKVLNSEGKYFTVSQHDDGVLGKGKVRLPNTAAFVEFAAGGPSFHQGLCVPIPLLCDQRYGKTSFGKRDLLASFVGVIENGPKLYHCRRAMAKEFQGRQKCYVRDTSSCVSGYSLPCDEQFDYVELMRRSEFALCPRGYGPTSFRLYEAMQHGAIPVYIHDGAPWLPWPDLIDWDKIAVVVSLDDVPGLHSRLESISAAKRACMRSAILSAQSQFFTMQKTMQHIVSYLKSGLCTNRETSRQESSHHQA